MLSRRAFRRLAVATVALLLVEIVAVSTNVLGTEGSMVLNRAWEAMATTASLTAWGWSATRYRGAQRQWRLWMTASSASFLVGLVSWIWDQSAGGSYHAAEGLGPAGFLLAAFFALVAVLRHAYHPGAGYNPPLNTQHNRVISTLDLLIIISSLLLFVFVTLGPPLAQSWLLPGPNLRIGVALPLAYLLLTAGTICLVRVRRAARDLPVLFIALGAMAYVGSGMSYARLLEVRLTTGPAWLETGSVACPVFFFLAALAPASVAYPPGLLSRLTKRELAQLAVPYIPLVATLAFIATGMATGLDLNQHQAMTFLILMVLIILRQITTLMENSQLLRRAEHEALHEPLTGLANRTLFLHELERALNQNPTPLVLVFCDMDDFKEINDTFGHIAGDQVLAETARRLRSSVDPDDVVARLGGDEFALILHNLHEPVPEIERRLLSALQKPHVLDGQPHVASASIGVTSVQPNTSITTDELLHWADTAMYEAKRQGKNTLAHAPEPKEERFR